MNNKGKNCYFNFCKPIGKKSVLKEAWHLRRKDGFIFTDGSCIIVGNHGGQFVTGRGA